MNITLSIDGMHCASCTHAIEKQLRKNNTVQQAHVNLVTENVYISCDDNTSIDDLIATIKKAGYQAYADDE